MADRESSFAFSARIKEPMSSFLQRPASALPASQMSTNSYQLSVSQLNIGPHQIERSTSSFAGFGRPINPSSSHSKTSKLTSGSESPRSSGLKIFVRMNGSTSPPQAFRLYIPEHCCLCASSCRYRRNSISTCTSRMHIVFEIRTRSTSCATTVPANRAARPRAWSQPFIVESARQ